MDTIILIPGILGSKLDLNGSETEAFPWNEAPRYIIRDRDRIYGAVVTRRLRAMGIRDKPTAPASFLAEWLCRTADRVDPPRVPGSHRRFW